MKRILIISFSDLATDPRVHRQIKLLSSRYEVLAAGTAPPQIAGMEFFRIPQTPRPLSLRVLGALDLKLGRYESYYWADRRVQACLAALSDVRADIILANDLNTLPLACALAKGAKVVFDAHEYAPREYEDRPRWRFFYQRYCDQMCKAYLPRVDAMFTVCQSIADEYRSNYGVESKVVFNAPPFHDLSPQPVSDGLVRMIHHGGTISSRKLELMIESIDFLDQRFHLDLMLLPSTSSYFRKLERAAAQRPRVRILPPVPMTELPGHLNRYDIGVFLLPPTNFNYRFALPNKLFEFIQARLAIAVGPSPEMARVVRQYDCGVVADDFTPQSLALRLNSLDVVRIEHFKFQSNRAASELCFERSADVMLATMKDLANA